MAKAVFGLVDSEGQAERIVDGLKAAGFSNNDISVLFPDKTGSRDFAHEQNTKAPEGAAAGAGTGGVVGGVFGWLVGIGSLAIPGVGPWTVTIYRLMALGRADAWPASDIALAQSLAEVRGLASRPTPEEMVAIAEAWRPWRAVAARILWHGYLETRAARRVAATRVTAKYQPG